MKPVIMCDIGKFACQGDGFEPGPYVLPAVTFARIVETGICIARCECHSWFTDEYKWEEISQDDYVVWKVMES